MSRVENPEYVEETLRIQKEIGQQNARRVSMLKRVLRELAALPRTTALEADMNSLEALIDELGGDGATGAHRAHRAIRSSKPTSNKGD